MSDLSVENYRRSATRIVEHWRGKIEKPARRMLEIDTEVREIAAKKPPGDEDKKRLAELKKDYETQRKAIEKANTELRLELSLIEPPQKTKDNEKELIKLPDWIGKIVEAKGVPIGKNVSIAPDDVDFDLKAMKLKGLSFKLTWLF